VKIATNLNRKTAITRGTCYVAPSCECL